MFTDLAKSIARGVAVAGAIALVIVLFTVVTVPTPQWGQWVTSINQAYAVMRHWCPVATTILPIALQLVLLEITIMGVELAGIAIRWVFKTTE